MYCQGYGHMLDVYYKGGCSGGVAGNFANHWFLAAWYVRNIFFSKNRTKIFIVKFTTYAMDSTCSQEPYVITSFTWTWSTLAGWQPAFPVSSVTQLEKCYIRLFGIMVKNIIISHRRIVSHFEKPKKKKIIISKKLLYFICAYGLGALYFNVMFDTTF